MSGPWVAVVVVLWVAVIVLATTVLGLLRRVDAVLERTEAALVSGVDGPALGARPGDPVPRITAVDRDGRELRLDSVRERRTLVILDPGCVPCNGIREQLDAAPGVLSGRDVVVVLPAVAAAFEWNLETCGSMVAYQRHNEVAAALSCMVSPAMYVFAAGPGGARVEVARVPDGVEDILTAGSAGEWISVT